MSRRGWCWLGLMGAVLLMQLGGAYAQRPTLTVWHAWQGAEADVLARASRTHARDAGIEVDLVRFETPAALLEKLQAAASAEQRPDLFVGPHTWGPQLAEQGIVAAYCLPGECPECESADPPRWCRLAMGDPAYEVAEPFRMGAAYCEREGCQQCEGPNPAPWCPVATGVVPAELDLFHAAFATWRPQLDRPFPWGIPIAWEYPLVMVDVEGLRELGVERPETLEALTELAPVRAALGAPRSELLGRSAPRVRGPAGAPRLALPSLRESELEPIVRAGSSRQLRRHAGEPEAGITWLPIEDQLPEIVVHGAYVDAATQMRGEALALAYALGGDHTQRLLQRSGLLPVGANALAALDGLAAELAAFAEDGVLAHGTDPLAGLEEHVARPERQDFFFSDDERIELRWRSGQLGVLVGDGVGRERLLRVIGPLGLEVVRAYPNGLYILALEQPLERLEALELARELRSQAEGIIAQAGLVFTLPQFDTPLVVSDELVLQVKPGMGDEAVRALQDAYALELIMENPFVEDQYLVRVTERSEADPLEIANRLHRDELVAFSHPNFIKVVEMRETIPNDPLFPNQWHLRNFGQSSGTDDADTDASWAWDLNMGGAGTVIAVIDGGFDMNHPDLLPNFWTNPGETAGNGTDDDGNGFVDDINGWDFTGCDAAPGPGCGDADPTGPDTGFGRHGTAVAGVAAARGDNALGGSGSCPECGLMVIRLPNTDFAQGLTFGYAQQMGAAVITNSWGFAVGTPCTTNLCGAINNAANNGRGGLGSVVLFAMNNPNVNDCVGTAPDISSLANVIGVSRSTNRDQFDFSGFGNCMDLLAPSAGLTTVSSGRGTLWITTTDMTGAAGYNNNATSATCPTTEAGPPPANARDYTACFNGTSSATPLAAGIAGLVLNANPNLTRLQVQRLLQDTADKVEDSTGAYGDATGFSAPATGQATHGFGRVNAFEAVRVAAPVADEGLGGVDVFIRDNRLDWGNTEQPSNVLMEPTRGFIPHYRSVDVKVDAPPYQPVPTTSAQFDAFVHENPVSGALNRVFVRVHNRGPNSADTVTVKAQWAFAGTSLPSLPADYWTQFPNDSTDPASRWTSLNPAGTTASFQTVSDLGYSGASVAGGAADASQILQFDFQGPTLDPSEPAFRHYCLLVVIDSPQDPVSDASQAQLAPDVITPRDNNVTHRNVALQDPTRSTRFEELLYVRNPFRELITSRLRLVAPRGWEVAFDPPELRQPFRLEPGEEVLLTVRTAVPNERARGTVEIQQEWLDGDAWAVLGGMSFEVAAGREPSTQEDCIAYDPARLRIVDEGAAGWLLTDGRSRMLMLDDEADARAALALARRHTMQCFIGRDNTRPERKDYIVQYWQ